MDPKDFLMALGDFPTMIDTLDDDLWSQEMTQTVDTIAPWSLLSSVRAQVASWLQAMK